MNKIIRWGILGTGSIARKFAEGLAAAEGAELAAVGSRDKKTAEAFGDQFRVPRRHGSYEALAEDKEVDVVYVATPHPFHCENTMLCLEAGKAVLCEKPFSINATEARGMVDAARLKKLFLMEAMWTRFLPHMCKVREIIEAGTIGDVQMVTADFGFRAGWNPLSRLLSRKLGGGGLLDVGVYSISLASMLLGRPKQVMGLAKMGLTGVDEQAAMLLGYDKSRFAALTCAVRTTTPHEAHIFGTDGMILLHSPWWRGTTLTLKPAGKDAKEETFTLPFPGNGLTCEAMAVMKCLAEGNTESKIMPLDESVAVMETMDELRRQWGLKYPGE